MEGLNDCAGKVYDIKMIMRMEKMILNFLEWKIQSVVTTQHFLKYYVKSILPHEKEKTWKKLRAYAKFFADMILLESEFFRHTPSHLACSCLVLSRRMLDLEEWPEEIVETSGISRQDIDDCVGHLDQYYKENYPQKCGGSPTRVGEFDANA
jgi:hypothetical protein